MLLDALLIVALAFLVVGIGMSVGVIFHILKRYLGVEDEE